MTNPSQNSKKKRITFSASKEGLEKAEKALKRLGFESKSNFAESQHLSRGIVTKFFNQQPIQLDSFKRICEALKLNWKEIAGITEESITSSQLEKQTNPSLGLADWVEKVQTIVRQVIAVDERSQEVLAAVILEGDINSVQSDAVAFHSDFSKKYPGSTIKVMAIQNGSIKLFIKGSPEDIQRLLSDYKAGKITEINGFPVQDIQILSETSEDRESNEPKWRLVEEIITYPIEKQHLSYADLSDADLRNASLINANLSHTDLSDADLSGVNLSGANLSDANLSGADLILADLRLADLRLADLSDANLSDANLSRANLSRAYLRLADLSNADLSRAYLIGADLSNTDLSRANLSDANLRLADLSDADLSGTNVENAQFSNNKGISGKMKQDLIKRGAIFDDSPGDRSFVRV